MRLYLGTSNSHKVSELQAMLAAANLPLEVHGADDLGGMPYVVEDADSFAGNALKKASALIPLLPEDGWALADDSGLCVEALQGAPGVYSARYAGEKANDRENVAKLLQELDAVPDNCRAAAFECHLALVPKQGEQLLFAGRCLGSITRECRGHNGFGYDPVFVPEGQGASFAEMESNTKAALSHRGKALQKLVEYLAGSDHCAETE